MYKILYLDDDMSDIAYAFANFKDSDYILECVSTQEDALEKLAKGAYTLVISDMLMTPNDGLAFAHEMEYGGIKAPLIFISGDPHTLREKEYKAIKNCKGFILKPLTTEKIKEFV